jgi:small subunit ribosomal protein S8
MSCSDPIADMLTIIRNGVMAGKKKVAFSHSRIKEGLARVLVEEGYLSRFEVLDTEPARTINVYLKYGKDGEQVIHEIRRVSRPGRRLYRGRKDLKPVLAGYGISVVSTSKGVLSDRACREANLGGEVLCVLH